MPIEYAEDGSLSMVFIARYLNYPDTNISLRGMSNTWGLTTPDSLSEFVGLQVDRLEHISGAINVGSQSGDLHPNGTDYDYYITFQDQTYGGGNDASSVWKLLNTSQFGGEQNVDVYIFFKRTGGATLNALNIYSSNNSTGPWTLRDTEPASGIAGDLIDNYIPSSSSDLYFRLEIDKQDQDEDTLYTVDLAVGILVLDNRDV